MNSVHRQLTLASGRQELERMLDKRMLDRRGHVSYNMIWACNLKAFQVSVPLSSQRNKRSFAYTISRPTLLSLQYCIPGCINSSPVTNPQWQLACQSGCWLLLMEQDKNTKLSVVHWSSVKLKHPWASWTSLFSVGIVASGTRGYSNPIAMFLQTHLFFRINIILWCVLSQSACQQSNLFRVAICIAPGG